MADKRAFAKFDVGYLDNPKMLDVLDASCNAILMHVASVLYCAQHLTDGFVAAKAMQRKAGGTDADTEILLSAGLWHASGHDCDGCPEPPVGKVYVHDFLEHNREAAQVKKVSKKRSDAAKVRWDAEKEAMQNALQNDDVCNAEREREKEREEAKASSSEIPRPDVDGIIQGFSELLEVNDVKHKPGETWHTAARLLIDKDGYTPEQIMFVAKFATTDDFWKSNILSVPKLREKFEALKIKAQAKSKPGSSKPTTSDKMRDTMSRGQALQDRLNNSTGQTTLQIGA
ncbi:MAG: hypothetical protein M3536_06380 [Actinomycetota bacterium]|nr:hypothetical protein [Actinomycetota bacterium]